MFAMMCYELLLYVKYTSFDQDIENSNDMVNYNYLVFVLLFNIKLYKKLLRINRLYKWKNELLEQVNKQKLDRRKNILGKNQM